MEFELDLPEVSLENTIELDTENFLLRRKLSKCRQRFKMETQGGMILRERIADLENQLTDSEEYQRKAEQRLVDLDWYKEELDRVKRDLERERNRRR